MMSKKIKNIVIIISAFIIVGVIVVAANWKDVKYFLTQISVPPPQNDYKPYTNIMDMEHHYDPDLSKLNIEEISKAIKRQQNKEPLTEQDLIAAIDIMANIFDRTLNWRDSVSQEKFDAKLSEIFKELPAQQLKKDIICINIYNCNDRKFTYQIGANTEYQHCSFYLYISKKNRIMMPLYAIADILDYKRILPDFADTITYDEEHTKEIKNNIDKIINLNKYLFGDVYKPNTPDFEFSEFRDIYSNLFFQYGYDTNEEINEYLYSDLSGKIEHRVNMPFENFFVRIDSNNKMHIRYGILKGIEYDPNKFYLAKQYVDILINNNRIFEENNVKAIALLCTELVPMYKYRTKDEDEDNEHWERVNMFYKAMQQYPYMLEEIEKNNYYGSKTMKHVISNLSHISEYIDYPSFVAKEDKYIHKENISGCGNGLPPSKKWYGTYRGTISNCDNFPAQNKYEYSLILRISENGINMIILSPNEDDAEDYNLSVDEVEWNGGDVIGEWDNCNFSLYRINGPETFRTYVFNHTKNFGTLKIKDANFVLQNSKFIYWNGEEDSDDYPTIKLLKDWKWESNSMFTSEIVMEMFGIDPKNYMGNIEWAPLHDIGGFDAYRDFVDHEFYPRSIFLDSVPKKTVSYTKTVNVNTCEDEYVETYKVTYNYKNDEESKNEYYCALTIETDESIDKYVFAIWYCPIVFRCIKNKE